MRTILSTLILFASFTLFAQVEKDVWAETETITTDLYTFDVPTEWRNYEKMLNKNQGPEQMFEASGKGIPAGFNGGPVVTTIFLVKLDNKNLKEAKKGVAKGYFENPDRVFEKKNDYDEEAFKLSNGDEAVILNTRFYRTSKGLNQSRYDLVTYSKKHKVAYMFTVSVQYNDETYACEKDYDLAAFAKKLYASFNWK